MVNQKQFPVPGGILEVVATIKHLKAAVVRFCYIPIPLAALASISVRWIVEMLIYYCKVKQMVMPIITMAAESLLKQISIALCIH